MPKPFYDLRTRLTHHMHKQAPQPSPRDYVLRSAPMTRERAEDYIWEAHDTYFVQHPDAETYTPEALYEYFVQVVPSKDEQYEVYDALGIVTCVACRKEQGLPEEHCIWCDVCACVFRRDDDDG